MKVEISHKELIRAILRADYSERDLRDFVGVCYSLAYPYVGSKMVRGKWTASALGLGVEDVAGDCIADLFERDIAGNFTQIGNHFKKEFGSVAECSDEYLLASLRRLIFAKVNLAFLLLLKDADPILGHIIHNLDVAISRSNCLTKISRLGEPYIAPQNQDLLMECGPMTVEEFESRFCRVVVATDSVPTMLNKLHTIVCIQSEFRRVVPFVPFALLVKRVIALTTETVEESSESLEGNARMEEILQSVKNVCNEVRAEMHQTYVGNGKVAEDVYEKYIIALRDTLVGSDGNRPMGGESYYDFLLLQMPQMSRDEYTTCHRSVMEYLGRIAKQKLRKMLE
jgi:hypothetical protein